MSDFKVLAFLVIIFMIVLTYFYVRFMSDYEQGKRDSKLNAPKYKSTLHWATKMAQVGNRNSHLVRHEKIDD